MMVSSKRDISLLRSPLHENPTCSLQSLTVIWSHLWLQVLDSVDSGDSLGLLQRFVLNFIYSVFVFSLSSGLTFTIRWRKKWIHVLNVCCKNVTRKWSTCTIRPLTKKFRHTKLVQMQENTESVIHVSVEQTVFDTQFCYSAVRSEYTVLSRL